MQTPLHWTTSELQGSLCEYIWYANVETWIFPRRAQLGNGEERMEDGKHRIPALARRQNRQRTVSVTQLASSKRRGKGNWRGTCAWYTIHNYNSLPFYLGAQPHAAMGGLLGHVVCAHRCLSRLGWRRLALALCVPGSWLPCRRCAGGVWGVCCMAWCVVCGVVCAGAVPLTSHFSLLTWAGSVPGSGGRSCQRRGRRRPRRRAAAWWRPLAMHAA